MSQIQLPAHSGPCHSITVYNGVRYVEEILQQATRGNDYLDTTNYSHLEDARFEHSPASPRGDKEPPEYRAISRMDGVWYPYNIQDVKNFGLPALEVKEEITDPHPADGLEATGQDDAQSEDVVASAESLTPATPEKKSRTSR